MAFKKYVARQRRRFGRFTKKRYGTWKNPKLTNIIKDVKLLKDVINAEKKRFTISGYGQNIGQVFGTGSGHYNTDLTPTMAQGTTYQTRNGSSIKLHSMYLKLQFTQQTGCVAPIRFKIYILKTVGKTQSNLNTYSTEILQPNPFVSGTGNIYDLNSSFNPDNYGQIKIVATKKCYMPVDNISGQTQLRDCEIKIKWNKGKGHHVRFDKDTTTVTDGQIWMLIVADNGNASSGTPNTATSGVPQTAVSTGMSFSFNAVHYYYDN